VSLFSLGFTRTIHFLTHFWVVQGDHLQKLFPKLYEDGTLPRGNPELDNTLLFVYNGAKGRRILGFQYRGVDRILRDTMEYFSQKGWVKVPAA
jgi:hypothetical protein